MGQRVAALRAPVPGRRLDGEREVGDRQPLVLLEQDQYDAGGRRVKQAVRHHGDGAQLVRLLRRRVPPVGDHDPARGEAGHRLGPSARGVPHAS
jgi:hypothetical protein